MLPVDSSAQNHQPLVRNGGFGMTQGRLRARSPSRYLTCGINVPLRQVGNALAVDGLVPEGADGVAGKDAHQDEAGAPHGHDHHDDQGDLLHPPAEDAVVLQQNGELEEAERHIVEEDEQVEGLLATQAESATVQHVRALSCSPLPACEMTRAGVRESVPVSTARDSPARRRSKCDGPARSVSLC